MHLLESIAKSWLYWRLENPILNFDVEMQVKTRFFKLETIAQPTDSSVKPAKRRPCLSFPAFFFCEISQKIYFLSQPLCYT
jgi:hypothetical protein